MKGVDPMEITENDIYRITYKHIFCYLRNEDLPCFEKIDGLSYIKGMITVSDAVIEEMRRSDESK